MSSLAKNEPNFPMTTVESLSGLMLRTSPFGSLTSTISPDWILDVLSSEFMLEVDILE